MRSVWRGPWSSNPMSATASSSGTVDRIELTGPPPSADGANELLWYVAQFQRLANGQDFDPGIPSLRSLQQHMLLTFGQQALTNARHTITTCCSAPELRCPTPVGHHHLHCRSRGVRVPVCGYALGYSP